MSEGYVDYDCYVDYKDLYYKMKHAMDAAMNILIEAQHECEELYTDAVDKRLSDLGLPYDNDDDKENAGTAE